MHLSKKEYKKYFSDDINQTWDKCFEVWKIDGRVEDLPHGERRFSYIPNLGKRLGLEFAEQFFNQYEFLIPKLNSADIVIKICAFELVSYIVPYFEDNFPQQLKDINIEIPEPVSSEIKSEFCSEHSIIKYSGKTMGDFFHFTATAEW